MTSTFTSHTMVQVIALVTALVLITLVSLYGKSKYKRVLTTFLIVSVFWSSASLVANMDLPYEQAVFWAKLLPFLALGTTIAYAYFIAEFTNYRKDGRMILWGGAVLMISLIAIIISGYVPGQYLPLSGDTFLAGYEAWYKFATLCGLAFLVKALLLLFKIRGITNSPEERNRTAYLFLGLSFFIVFGIVSITVPGPQVAYNHIGHLINASLVTYAVVRYRLIDIKLVIRKSIVITGIGFFIFDSFLVFYGLNPFLNAHLSTGQQMAVTVAVVFALAFLFNPLRSTLEKYSYLVLYGKRYDYREMVMHFADRMRHVMEMPDLAEAMLQPIARAVNASQVGLLFGADGYYQTYFAERYNPREPIVTISLSEDGPIISWLKQNDTPLYRDNVVNLPEFRNLRKEEMQMLEIAQVELLCPIKSKNNLVAILALSEKQPNGIYQQDDIDLITTMAHEAAVVIENAQLYAKAKERANTDELTGLFNHRYFHQRLDEEIARCSRFGYIFSVVLADVDMFKKYNDVYGHLAGDGVLTYLGNIIQQSLRKVDLGFRYGGDEFAILLPEAPLKGAKKIAEQLRREMEMSTNLRGTPLTCSFGVGSWPTDGLMKEEILQSTDAALYLAKQAGRNQICLANEVPISDILTPKYQSKQQSKKAILNTIYALAATVDAKDSYTYGHSKKVSTYAADIAEAIGYSPEDIERIRAIALLHDIGKIGIADNILNKRGSLSPEDFEPIKAHPEKGVAILKHVDSLKEYLPGVQYHHEHYDGTGYPAGLKGESIPLDARILAVADAYDAMTSQRPYRQRRATPEEAIEELKKCVGTQFDPEIVRVFVDIMEKKEKMAKTLEGVLK